MGEIRIQHINLVLSFCGVSFSPSTAFAVEVSLRGEVVVKDLLDQRSPALFVRHIAIDDNVDVRGVASLFLVFPPLFVSIKFLFERTGGVRDRCGFRGPER